MTETIRVQLFWLPLGAGGHSVRWNGRVFEALIARHQRRTALDLYHSALEVDLGSERFAIEMAPVWSGPRTDRGAALEGAVGSRWLGCSAFFRYEVRCWRDGVIPDAAEAMGGPHDVSTDRPRALRLLALVPHLPALTWGRDELRTGEMWNSNSVVSWLLARSGHDVQAIEPPAHGRAPGWQAGLVAADREGAFVDA